MAVAALYTMFLTIWLGLLKFLWSWRQNNAASFRRNGPHLQGLLLGTAVLIAVPSTLVELTAGIHFALLAGVAAALPSVVLRAYGRLRPGTQTSRRRRRRSLGTASTGAESEFDIEDISATGALLRVEGPRSLAVGQWLDLKLSFEGRSTPVRAQVVRQQRPEWTRIGGVGVRFDFTDNEPSRLLVEAYAGDDPDVSSVSV
jgi:hypothetical protein